VWEVWGHRGGGVHKPPLREPPLQPPRTAQPARLHAMALCMDGRLPDSGPNKDFPDLIVDRCGRNPHIQEFLNDSHIGAGVIAGPAGAEITSSGNGHGDQ
jgi:hypothetical protein